MSPFFTSAEQLVCRPSADWKSKWVDCMEKQVSSFSIYGVRLLGSHLIDRKDLNSAVQIGK